MSVPSFCSCPALLGPWHHCPCVRAKARGASPLARRALVPPRRP
ncbi:hypothetical protein HMPREF1868_01943 [Olsenella sp. DNF00959]|nr:hypothetical protein HMPREF1868_01943 [Olsenella sp. DNF00959]